MAVRAQSEVQNVCCMKTLLISDIFHTLSEMGLQDNFKDLL